MLLIYFVVVIYCCAFIFGTLGNLFVMVQMIRRKLCFPANHRQATPRERSRVFIFILAVTDFAVLATIPLSLAQILDVQWIFGSFLCKFHAAVDLSGKFFSVVILTSMSCERFLVVCTRFRYTSTPTRLMVLPLGFGILFAVIIPIVPQILYTNLYEIRLEEEGVNFTQRVCLHYMPLHLVPIYVQYTFLTGFLLPFVIMAVCYVLLVRHVRQKYRERTAVNRSPHSSLRGNRPKYMNGLTRSIIRIAIFHFSCWAPFWIFSLMPVFADAFGLHFNPQADWFQSGKLLSNLLPYINSAGNSILYAWLNKDIRKHLWRPNSRLRTGKESTPGTALQSAVLQSESFNPTSD
ncbi:Npr-27 [Aphelenchoides fujianensis]|nr:Npr-27 [Aphelenchoides fujianensis]